MCESQVRAKIDILCVHHVALFALHATGAIVSVIQHYKVGIYKLKQVTDYLMMQIRNWLMSSTTIESVLSDYLL